MLTRIYFMMILAALAAGCSTVQSGARVAASHERWESTQGGVVAWGRVCDRAAAALERVAGDLPASVVHVSLRVRVLDVEAPVAFSFPDGAMYVSRELVERLTDDELAAAVAHEMGHLLHAGVIESPAALRGAKCGSGDIEQTADLLGRELLIAHHVPAGALTAALQKVAVMSQGTGYCGAIEARVRCLQMLDEAGR